MPNKRDPEKKMVAVWFSPEDRASLREAAAEAGLTMTDYLRQLLKKDTSQRTREISEEGKN